MSVGSSPLVWWCFRTVSGAGESFCVARNAAQLSPRRFMFVVYVV